MRLLPIAVALLGVLSADRVTAQPPQQPPSPQPSLVTTAIGEALVVPDRAIVILAVETRAQTANNAATSNARRQQSVIAAVRAMGIAAEQIRTTSYQVQADERWENNQRRIVGYIARNAIEVEIRRIDQAGAVIDTALTAGANVVGRLQFTSSRIAEVRREALADAVARARADAQAMAQAAGGSLGEVIELTSSGPVHAFDQAEMLAATADFQARQVETPITPGEQKVRVPVTVRWAFLPGRR
jgi:uncharacterized protein